MALDRITAAGFNIQLFEAEDLIAALDGSGDLRRGQTMQDFDDLLIDKYMEADPLLLADLDIMGIEQPVIVEVEDDGSWVFTDGHHRLAWAAVRKAQVPTILVEFDLDAISLDRVISEDEVFYNHH